MSITFTIPGKPIPQSRPKVSRRGGFSRTYYSKPTTIARTIALGHAKLYTPPTPFEGPVSVDLTFVLPPPSRLTKAERIALRGGAILYDDRHRDDLDNYCKLVLDAMADAGFFLRGDEQVSRLTATKLYTLDGHRTEVMIETLPLAGGLGIPTTSPDGSAEGLISLFEKFC